MAYIEVRDLTKRYTLRKKRPGHLTREKSLLTALDGMSFDVRKGEILGYIGPNGAGKSTTVKLLCGILTPDSGSACVGGLIPWEKRREHVRRIGVVFGQRSQLWWDVPVQDSYSLLRDIYRIPETLYSARLKVLTEELGLENLMHTPLRQLSLGQRMRAELGGSLLHGPELLFLDEPTIGLDAVSKLQLRDFLKKENARNGTTILLTTHDMEDISALCSRVLVLGHGRKLYDGPLPDLLARYDTARVITVRYEDQDTVVPALPAGCVTEREGEDIRVIYDPSVIPTARMLTLLQSAGPIRELTAQPRSIDHLIAAMYREMDL